MSDLIKLMGINLNKLEGLDLAKYAPMLKPLLPAANAYADSGNFLKYIKSFSPTLQLENKTFLEPQIRKTAKRAKVRLGPFTLDGKNVSIICSIGRRSHVTNENKTPKPKDTSSGGALSMDGQSFIHIIEGKSLCSNCTLLSSLSSLEFEDGTQADLARGVFIHHVSAADISRSGVWTVLPCDYERWNFTKQPLSATVPFVTFSGGGEDNRNGPILYTTLDGTYDSGFHLLPKSELMYQMELVNYNDDAKKLYTTIDYEYIDGIHGQAVVPNLIPVTGCKFLSPNINMTGPAETISKEFAVLVDGTLIVSSKFSSQILLAIF
jgi:hypothetical protein